MPIRSVSQNRTWSVSREVRYAGTSAADLAGAAAGPDAAAADRAGAASGPDAPAASGASERPGLSCGAAMNCRPLVRDRPVMEQADVVSGPARGRSPIVSKAP